MLREVNMAAGESDLAKSLSENLTPDENDMRLPACEEKDLGSESESKCLNKDSSEERSEMNDLKQGSELESENCQKINEASGDSMDRLKTEFINNFERENSERQSKSSSRRGGKLAADEALLEEDEDEMELSDHTDEEENYESAEEEHLTPEEAEGRKVEAMELKNKGNEHFRNQEYVEGKDFYSRAIKKCPKEYPENKSVFYANRAACLQKMDDYEGAIGDCSKALELAPNYLKAQLRRAQCYEKVEKLEEALEDYKIVFESDSSCQTAREAIIRLPEEIKVKHEKLKEEMIGKLKELGNMVLRPFGLSTNNFNLQQDPNSGGYSINFQK